MRKYQMFMVSDNEQKDILWLYLFFLYDFGNCMPQSFISYTFSDFFLIS